MNTIDKERLISALRLKIGRGNYKTTQAKVAKKLNLSQGTVSKVLNGHFSTITPPVESICRHVGIDPFATKESLNPSESKILVDALARNWDGSEEHAHVLADFIDSIGRTSRKYAANSTKANKL